MKKWILGIILLSVVTVQAQGNTCPAIVENALNTVAQLCADVARNQACYGNLALSALPAAEVSDLTFDSPGDIESIQRISSMTLSNLDESAGTWGIALMKVQANLPDTLPGQNVTILLFGDTEVTNFSGDMNTFYLKTGIGSAACAEMPGSGILIQTPEGVGEVDLTVNGIEIRMGSTLYLRAVAGDATYISVLAGSAQVTAEGITRVVPAGSSVVVPIDADLNASRPPLPVGVYPPEITQGLPVNLLPQSITIAGAQPTAVTVTQQPAPPLSSVVYHTVQRGENLFRIALYYDTSIQSIADANNLADPRQIYAGQVLLIPNPGSGYRGLPTSPLLPPTLTPVPGTTTTPSGAFIPAEGGYIHVWDTGSRYVYNLQNVDPGRTFYLNTDMGNFLFTVDSNDRHTFHGRTYDQQLISITFTSTTSYRGCASWFNSCFVGGQ